MNDTTKPRNHEAHQQMLAEHRDRKHERRDLHQKRKHWRSVPLVCLI